MFYHGKHYYDNDNYDQWSCSLQFSLWTEPKSVVSISLYQIVFCCHPCHRNFIVFFGKFYCHHRLFFWITYLSLAKYTSSRLLLAALIPHIDDFILLQVKHKQYSRILSVKPLKLIGWIESHSYWMLLDTVIIPFTIYYLYLTFHNLDHWLERIKEHVDNKNQVMIGIGPFSFPYGWISYDLIIQNNY